ncbi:MAG TPA: membrane protein insertion efficiency factor YidD [Oscillospiraceae bacterium]|nr:membrane protein insertion efficiency factor YidD [Oscillospiraceae bacterium]
MKYVFMAIIWIYKKLISPMFGARCRFYPSCSTYGMTAIERFGAIKGGYLAIRRILRCNPYNVGGVDYVPEEFFFRRKNNKD